MFKIQLLYLVEEEGNWRKEVGERNSTILKRGKKKVKKVGRNKVGEKEDETYQEEEVETREQKWIKGDCKRIKVFKS